MYIEDMVLRRMKNTGETREQATEGVLAGLQKIRATLESGGSYDVFDDDGRIVGTQDAKSFRPTS